MSDMDTAMMFERTQKVILFKEDGIYPKVVVEKNGNYASYSTYMNTQTALPETVQTIPLKLFTTVVCGLYDEGYKIIEQVNNDEDLC